MRPHVFAIVLLLSTTAFPGPAEDYLKAMLHVVDGLERGVPDITAIADEAAERLAAGGQLYLAGEPGMVAELHGRAGGLCGARRFAGGKTLVPKNAVVLLSNYGYKPGGPGDGWAATGEMRALRVLFISAHSPILKKPPVGDLGVITVDIPADGRVVSAPDGRRLASAAAPAIAIAQWTFVAELIGACRRRGRQLAVYLSIHLDEGRKRYKRTKGLLFEPGLKAEPVPKGQLAKTFLGHVRASLEAIQKRELGNVRKAAAWIRAARAAGHNVYRQLHGHLPPHEAGVPGDPGCFTHTVRPPLGEKGAAWVREHLRKGDVYLLVGYQQNEDAMSAAANALGARTIFLTSLPPAAQRAKHPLHLYVDPHWPLTDACLELPGYDVRACPLSAILGLTCYYAIGAEVIAGGK